MSAQPAWRTAAHDEVSPKGVRKIRQPTHTRHRPPPFYWKDLCDGILQDTQTHFFEHLSRRKLLHHRAADGLLREIILPAAAMRKTGAQAKWFPKTTTWGRFLRVCQGGHHKYCLLAHFSQARTTVLGAAPPIVLAIAFATPRHEQFRKSNRSSYMLLFIHTLV
jgi:hypothetical protein